VSELSAELGVDADQGSKEGKGVFILKGHRIDAGHFGDSRIGEFMNHDEHSRPRPFWRSTFGLALIGFLAVAAVLLIAEHQAHIFVGNWFIWLIPLMCLGMHFFHGGHGGHDGPSSKGQ
jgi:hypothetical protein